MIQSQVWQESWEEPPWHLQWLCSSNRPLRNPNTWARCRAGLWLPCTEHHFPAIESEDLGIHKSIILGVAPLAKFPSICSHTFVPRSPNSAFCLYTVHSPQPSPQNPDVHFPLFKASGVSWEKVTCTWTSPVSVWNIPGHRVWKKEVCSLGALALTHLTLLFFFLFLQVMGMVASFWYLVGKSPHPSTHKFVSRCGARFHHFTSLIY